MAIEKTNARDRRRERTRKNVQGTLIRPRLSIYRSISHFHAQIIDDRAGKTLLGISTQSKDFKSTKDAAKNAGNKVGAKDLGKLLARKALESKITQVVFDRGGFLFHGRIKEFAIGAREGGLKF